MSIDLPLKTESNDMIILTLNSLSKNFLRLNILIRVIIDLGLKQMENSSVSYCLDTVLKLYCLIPI